MNIPPSFVPSWTPDDETESCYRCDQPFNVMARRHHCRACGKIFCSVCSNYNSSIPSYIHKIYGANNGPLRVCYACNMIILQKKKSKRYIFVLSIVPLTIKELEVMLYVNKQWNMAAVSVIGMFKAIQYKTGYQKWSGLERRLLKTHWKEFIGHSRLMVKVMRGLVGVSDLSIYAREFKCTKKHVSCADLYCDRCCEKLGPFDLIELLYSQQTASIISYPEIESWIGTCINDLTDNWLLLLIPWLMQMVKTPPAQRIISNNILPRAVTNRQLAYKIFFECEMLRVGSYYLSIQTRLMSILPPTVCKSIRESHKLFALFENPLKLKQLKIQISNVRLPYDPETVVRSIDHNGIRQLSSYTKPFVIPLKTSRGRIEILQKMDDVRTDRLVINIMKILEFLNKKLFFHKYFVFPLSTARGWIEMLPNTKTVYEINKESSIQNYIIEHNKKTPSGLLRKAFVRSCASNCLLGYMLGLGDRNLHNILICPQTATLAHIDFNYLLGRDPKIESTEMKITSGMVDMLGGYNSEEYEEMKVFCSKAFHSIKSYTYFWYPLLRYLCVSDPPIISYHGELQKLQHHIDKRLMPTASYEEVRVAIVKSVNSNSNSWKSSLSDIAHSFLYNMTGVFEMEM